MRDITPDEEDVERRTPPIVEPSEKIVDYQLQSREAKEVIANFISSSYFRITDEDFSQRAEKIREQLKEIAFQPLRAYFVQHLEHPIFLHMEWLLPETSIDFMECVRPHGHVLPSVVLQRWSAAIENLPSKGFEPEDFNMSQRSAASPATRSSASSPSNIMAYSPPITATDYAPFGNSFQAIAPAPKNEEERLSLYRRQSTLLADALTLPGEVPEALKDRLPLTEFLYYQRRFGDNRLITTRSTWPLGEFLGDYAEIGTDTSIKNWCLRVAQKPEKIQTYTASLILPLPVRTETLSTNTEKILTSKALIPNCFVRVRPKDIIPTGELTFQTLFPDVKPEKAMKYWGNLPPYDEHHVQGELDDYCTWYALNRSRIHAFGVEYANYTLLQLSPQYAQQHAFHAFQRGLVRMNTDSLATALGAFVYQHQDKDPLQVSYKLCPGKFQCSDREDVYRRCIELVRCQYNRAPPHKFCGFAFAALGFHMLPSLRRVFHQRCAAVYPTLAIFKKDAKYALAVTKPLPVGQFHLPITPDGCHTFLDWILEQALEPTIAQMEADVFQEIAGDLAPFNSRYGPLEPRLSSKYRNRPGQTPRTPIVVAVQQQTALTTPITPSPAINAQKERPQCTHCKKGGHIEDNCYTLHPEKRAEALASRSKEICQHCQKPGHNQDVCYTLHPEKRPKRQPNEGKQRTTERPFCNHCVKVGHLIDNCFVLYPEKRRTFQSKASKRLSNPNNIPIKEDSEVKKELGSSAIPVDPLIVGQPLSYHSRRQISSLAALQGPPDQPF